MNVLILGVTGLIGSTVAKVFSSCDEMNVFGSTRNIDFAARSIGLRQDQLYRGVDVENISRVIDLLEKTKPAVVINCAGITKHLPGSSDPIVALSVNSIFPHRIAGLCKLMGARLVQISSDCVFSGSVGGYTEESLPDAFDLYGKSKALGEISDQDHCLTLRTSTIGHEINTKYGLLEWFLDQDSTCHGFSRAIFSGLTTLELAKVIKDVLLTKPNLSGLYNIAADPISKYDLLCLISGVYNKKIHIQKNDQYIINRSLNAEKFHKQTSYMAPNWVSMIEDMFRSKNNV